LISLDIENKKTLQFALNIEELERKIQIIQNKLKEKDILLEEKDDELMQQQKKLLAYESNSCNIS
jgi:hypothetical protein